MSADPQSPTARILVVDDDEWILEMVSLVLHSRGYLILTASDGEEGLIRAQSEKPHLIITDVVMPRMNGWTLVKRLRSMREFAFVPVIFLTALDSAKDRIQGFRLGADDYLPKPFLPEELDLRVAKALQRLADMKRMLAAQSRPQPREAPGLQGSLAQLGLPSLLTMLEMEQKSGLLVVTSLETAETGRLFLKDGTIVSASFDGKDAPRNEEVVYRLLGWHEGRFHFQQHPVELDDEMNTPTTFLLLEGSRRLDAAPHSN